MRHEMMEWSPFACGIMDWVTSGHSRKLEQDKEQDLVVKRSRPCGSRTPLVATVVNC